VKASREAAAERVRQAFSSELPDLKLLAYFDDRDVPDIKQKLGLTNRGIYFRIKDERPFRLPNHMGDLIFVRDPISMESRDAFDHVIYLHGGTCADEIALTMTFAHELQHFVQYGFKRKLWAVNSLIPRLPKEVWLKERLYWHKFPHEQEARIKAKQVGVKLCGEDAVNRYIDHRIDETMKLYNDHRIDEAEAAMEEEDWRFSQKWDLSIRYDLPGETRQIFQRLRPYRREIENVLRVMRENKYYKDDYKDVDLSGYFDGD
jgi:hypothetical protein